MLLNNEWQSYLTGKRFSNGVVFDLSESSPLRNRFDYLGNLVEGKTVLHIGCADHLPLIEKKRAENTWLHDHLLRQASRCVGIDTNEKAIEYLRTSCKLEDVICGDVTKTLPPEIQKESWDFVLLPEVLEHIPNPQAFLRGLHTKLMGHATRLVVTVPNAFSIKNRSRVECDKEVINTDHCFWFTPYTLAKIVTASGFHVEELDFVTSSLLVRRTIFHLRGRRGLWRLRRHPILRDTLTLIARWE